ncbi:hypothetical protein [Streptomyces pilosus]|uniref:hypothetical protein n=1 Tax=Streptomyces pilosus TaxID=28893 RepID=UPI0027E3F7CD|nr:hypothetical protein [Streptomyces pilosus]
MSEVSSSNVPPAEQSTGSLLNPDVKGTTTRSPPGSVTPSGGTSRVGGASSATRISAPATFRGGSWMS